MNLKAMNEKRAELVQKMNDLVAAADMEKRAMSAEEIAGLTGCWALPARLGQWQSASTLRMIH